MKIERKYYNKQEVDIREAPVEDLREVMWLVLQKLRVKLFKDETPDYTEFFFEEMELNERP